MSTSTVAVQGEVINPSATANAKESAHFSFAQVIKELIHAVPAAFPSENLQYQAVRVVDDYVKAHVSRSALPALADGNQRAPLEDVTQRIPPQGSGYIVPSSTPAIDYDRLAAAIVRQQLRLSEKPAPADSAEVSEDDNAS
jgi:hypothetical protein